jgi:hypothetical protein
MTCFKTARRVRGCFCFGGDVNELAKLSVDANLPTLTKAWEHNGEILGITEDGNLIVVAHLMERSEKRQEPPQSGQRTRRRRPEPPPGIPESLASSAELAEHYAPPEHAPDKEREAREKVERERGGRKKKEETISSPTQTSEPPSS